MSASAPVSPLGRGLSVFRVEPDSRMADFPRRNGLEVESATFEGWDPAGREFDMVVAGRPGNGSTRLRARPMRRKCSGRTEGRPPSTRAADGIREAGEFGEPEQWQFDWEQPHTRDEWLDQLPTLGTLPGAPRTRLLRCAGERRGRRRRDRRQVHNAFRRNGGHCRPSVAADRCLTRCGVPGPPIAVPIALQRCVVRVLIPVCGILRAPGIVVDPFDRA